MRESLQNCKIQPLPSFGNEKVTVDLLRLDLLHPVVSGNKWFKLRYYLQDALAGGKHTVASFGGAWSNHIVALAYAAREAGLNSIGYIRGEEPATPSQALLQTASYGMELVFLSREAYRSQAAVVAEYNRSGVYWIMEGGFGPKGAEGAADILKITDTSAYTHIFCAAGTGTMLAGLIRNAAPHQQVTGISVLKNHSGLEKAVRSLLTGAEQEKPFSILHDYHFGGYARHPGELLGFMTQTWKAEGVPTDIVYTSRLLFAAKDLVGKDLFPPGSRLLLIHSGGLQGNRSLLPGTLPF